MPSGRFRFDRFELDAGERRLTRDGVRLDLSTRYLDALALLLREAGRLVTKDRFLDEVWNGVPVTDEALTQCIRTLRRQLGDDAARPTFIETVPKHGYRFVAPVTPAAEEADAPAGEGGRGAPEAGYSRRRFLLLGGAGTIGAAIAGVVGGLCYGFAGASQPLAPGMGAVSVLLVLLWLTLAAALTGGAGVSFGIAATGFAQGRAWTVAGGAAGGLAIGGIVKLLGLDAFNLLLGRSPGDVAGAPEGALLGGAVGLGAWLATRGGVVRPLRRSIAAAALAGGIAGAVIPLLGGRLMGGSLDLLARAFPESRLRLDPIGVLFGESGFGPITQIVTGGAEGALFGGCIVGAIVLARRSLSEPN